MRALSKDPNDRFESAAELRAALESAGQLLHDRCPKCGAPKQSGRFCAECGTPFPSLTPTDGVAIPAALANALSIPTQHDLSLTLGPRAALAKIQPPTLPFCGREPLLGRLDRLERKVALVIGDPGMGKSLLAAAWADRRRKAGRRAIFVEADGPGLVAPLAPLRRAIAALLHLDDPPSDTTLSAVREANLEDLAGLTCLLGTDRGRSQLPLDVRRRECRAATLAVLRRSDVDVVFDDVHLYDAVSRSILEELAVDPGQATLLMTSTRAGALATEAASLERIELGPIEAPELSACGVSDEIIERADRHPFSVETALRAAAEGASAPTTAARVAVLPEEARRLLELLAAAGAPLPHASLEAAVGHPRLDVALSELARRGFIPQARTPYRLASPTLRREIYEGIDVERRRGLHARLGAVLDRAGADVHSVAYHALLSGDGEPPHLSDLGDGPLLSPLDGIGALERAGVAARQSFDDLAASRALRAAMERCRIAQTLGFADNRQLLHIGLKLGVVLRYANDLTGAEAVLREAAQLAQEERDLWAAVEARRALARVALLGGHSERGRAELNLAVKAALALGDPSALCETYLDLGDALIRTGENEEAARELDEGILLVTQGDGPAAESGPDALPRLIARLAEVYLSLGRTREAERHLGHALRLVAKGTRAADRARIHIAAARIRHAENRHEDAVEHHRLAVAELRSLGDRRSTAEELIALAEEFAEDSGALERRKAWLREAEQLAAQVDWR